MSDIHIKIARTLNDLMQVFAVRSLVYVGGQDCPYDEEFDGNDFTGASHIIAYLNKEPAGVLRLRWFAGFVKFERAAVVEKYRGTGVIQELMHFSFRYAQRRGYKRIITQAQWQLRDYWKRFGFFERSGRREFSFSDYSYVEMEKHLKPLQDAINANTDPMKLNRPDGEWEKPGVLDRSLARLVPDSCDNSSEAA